MAKKAPMSRQQKLRLVILIVLGLLLLAFTAVASLWVLRLRDPDTLAWFQGVIESLGLGGWFVLLAIQYIQIVVAFVPGGPIQIVAGALFKPLWGTLACFTGTILATFTVYWLVSRFGRSIVHLFVEEKDIKTYKFLQDNKKLERLVALLFLIPGTPKDALTYLFALTSLPIGRFMLISTAARMPAVLTSVLAGDRIMQGEWLQAAILFVVICLLGLVGFFIRRKVLDISKKRSG